MRGRQLYIALHVSFFEIWKNDMRKIEIKNFSFDISGTHHCASGQCEAVGTATTVTIMSKRTNSAAHSFVRYVRVVQKANENDRDNRCE